MNTKARNAVLGVGLIVAWGLLSYWPLQLARAATPEIAINELAWAGSSHAANDEWIELYNPGLADKDISGWFITKDTGTESLMVALPAAVTIPAGGFFVISHLDRTASVIDIDPGLVSTALTLSNTALRIRLYKGDWHDAANLVDIAGDGGVPPAGDNATKLSMERDIDFGGWHDAQTAINLDAGVMDVASPAATNSVIIQPPTITSIQPNTVIAGDTLNIEAIVGTNFGTETPSVFLSKDSQTLTASGVHLVNPELVDGGMWQIPDDASGKWDLVLTTAGGLSATLPEAVTVTEPPPSFDMSNQLRINELYPQPGTSSNDEFIELINLSGTVVNLDGWKLDDIENGGSTPYELDGLVVPAKGLLTIYKTSSKLTLNDSGDTVRLIQPSNLVLDSTSYSASSKGSSWARGNSEFKWTTTPTPNGLNVFTEPIAAPPAPPAAVDEADDVSVTYLPGVVLVDELLPKPMSGEEEFIELRNTATTNVDLAGWRVVDAANHQYKFPTNTKLAGGARLVIYKSVSSISLNDTGGEKLSLIDPTNQTISQLSYPDNAPIDAAYIRISGNSGTWVHPPTPGIQNPADMTEIETEVGGWVAGDTVDQLPVTGWDGYARLGLAIVSLLAIMVALTKQHGISIFKNTTKR